MSSAGIRIETGPQLGVCAVKGCSGMTFDDKYCPQCRNEINALEQWSRVREARQLCRLWRRQEQVESFRRAGRRVGKLIWIPELIFVVGGLVYLGWVFGAMFLQWMVGQ